MRHAAHQGRSRLMIQRAFRVTAWLAGALIVCVFGALVVFRGLAVVRELDGVSRHAPASGRFVPTPLGHVFIQEAGPEAGPAVLLVHGTAAWSEIWRPTLDALAGRGFRGIAVDLPPFGFSEKSLASTYEPEEQGRVLAAVLAALDLRDVVLVGHSFGARATLEALLSSPARVRALVLVDAALGLDVPADVQPPLPLRALLAFEPLRSALVASTLTNPLLTARLLQSLIRDPADATPEAVAMLQRPMTVRHSTRIAGNWLERFLVPSGRPASQQPETYGRLHLPVLLLWGDSDTVTPLPQAQRLHALLPQARLQVLPDVGHIPHLEDAAAFNSALLGFLVNYGPGPATAGSTRNGTE